MAIGRQSHLLFWRQSEMRNASIAALIFFLTIAAKQCSADLCPSCYAWQQAWFQALVDLNVALDDQEELLAYWQSEIVRILQTPPEKWDESVVYLLNQAQQGVWMLKLRFSDCRT